MYVCICNSVTDSDIRQAVRDGVRDQRELARKTGCSSDCGCCSEFALEVMNQALREQSSALPILQTA